MAKARVLAALLAAGLASPASAALRAAAGKADITPDLENEKVYLAGYGATGRRPTGVRDPFHVRAWVVSDGTTTVALAAVDSIGLFREDVEAMRRELGWLPGSGRYLLVAATHDHSAPDTLGLWGPLPGVSGVDPRYRRRLQAALVGLVRELSARLEPAQLWAARSELDPRGLCRDSRDPVVIDPELNVLQLRRPGGAPIGTLVRWSCHAEVLGSGNREATADYPGVLCARLEERTGGACAYFPGSIGGLMAPDVDRSGGVEVEFREMRRVGERLAEESLKALKTAERVPAAEVAFSSRVVRVPVENSRYLLFLRSLVFGHRLLDAQGRELPRWKTWWLPLRHLVLFPLPDALRPRVETEAALVRLGPVKLLGVPGELFPELAIGGFDGRYRFHWPLVRPSNANPPDLARAPKGPYLREKLGARHGLILGLANDELGYIIPEYDFQAAPTRSMTPKPAGTHYEETNSIGPSATAILLKAFDDLLR